MVDLNNTEKNILKLNKWCKENNINLSELLDFYKSSIEENGTDLDSEISYTLTGVCSIEELKRLIYINNLKESRGK